ncbi:DUF3795 domain-containing protein, partial [bacterium]|nr:DUF3795 domain-containing protein [bacterium]
VRRLSATQTDDNKKRSKVASLWSKQFRTSLKPKDINCDGCQSDSDRLFGHCLTCEIRKCGMEMMVANCAYCHDYSCEKLNQFFKIVPDAKKRLDAIRSTL